MTTKAELLRAVKAKCLDCCCYQPSEVRQCTSQRCDLWLYRLGRDPNPSRRGVPQNLPSGRAKLAKESNLGEVLASEAPGSDPRCSNLPSADD